MSGSTKITIEIEAPRQEAVMRMIAELDEYLGRLYSEESNHLLSIEELEGSDIRFFVARRNGEAIGCGALRIDKEGWGEVKRMFVLPTARGLNIGRALLNQIHGQALVEGIHCLRLETGINQPEAIGLYETAGFVRRGPFGSYKDDPTSIYMEKLF